MNRQKTGFFGKYKEMFTREFKGYNAAALVKDILSGMTVGAVALPLALAFGAASVDAKNAAIGIAAGLITAIVAGIVTGLLGGGSFQISGPTGAMTVVLTGIVAGKYGLTGMFLACFFAGALMLIAGLLRFGKLVSFIPKPVVTGFTSGIAIIIALGQLGNFFGVPLSGETTVEKTVNFFKNSLSDINWVAAICSLAVVLIMAFYPKKLAKFVPGSLVAIIIITVVTALLKADVATIGAIPSSLINSVHLDFTSVTPDMITGVAGAAVTIAALGMIESLLCGTCAANMKKESFDSNIELIAQGIGNMIVPLFGGVPSTAAIARTSVAINSGGKTRLTSVFQSLFLIACMFVFSGLIGFVPYPALAGVLAVTAFKMNDRKAIKYYFKNKLWDAAAMFLITMLATVFLDLTYAILIGVAFSMVLFAVKFAKLEISEHNSEKALTLTPSGALFFANSDILPKKLEAVEEEVIIDLSEIVYADVSAVDALSEAVERLKTEEKGVSFVNVSASVRRVFDKTGFSEKIK